VTILPKFDTGVKKKLERGGREVLKEKRKKMGATRDLRPMSAEKSKGGKKR